MKKILLSIIAIVSFASIGFGQLSVQDTSGVTLTNGDTVIVNGAVGYQLSGQFYIYSAFSLSANVFCAPSTIAVSGCTYSICVGSDCYPSKTDNINYVSPSFTVPTGKDVNALDADYNPSNSGTTVIRYDIRNTALTDSAWFFVEFNASPAGIPTISANSLNISNFFPNPANSIVNFTYHTNYDAQLNVYNSLGQLVKIVPVYSSKDNAGINTADLPSGLYICKLQAVGAEPCFRRLIVSH